MKVFLPFKRDKNKYLDEIENHFQGSFIYGSLDDYKKEYDIVNINWPEAIFHWKEPSDENIETLSKHIEKWKKNSKLIYTRHNEYPHYRNTPQFAKLYDLIHQNVDAIIHLGQYSLNSLKDKFPKIIHAVIYHPLYTTIPNNVTKNEARNKLGINRNANVVLVFGAIRSYEEQQMILKSFRGINKKNKLLLIPRFPFHTPEIIPSRLKKYFKLILVKYYSIHKKYIFLTKFIENNDIQNFLQASDVVFIARKKGLNSGNIFLGYTFKKAVVGPSIGNMTETLKRAKFPIFDPTNIQSVTQSLEKGIDLSKTNSIYNDSNIDIYLPQLIAKQYYNLFNKLANA